MAESREKEFVGLEAGRGVAAILVVLAHATGWAGNDPPFFGLFKAGTAGVDFFFVLSGFVIAHAHRADIGRPDSLLRYMWRRTTRIYPTWWMSILFAVPLIRLFPGSRSDIDWSIGYVVENIVLWPMPGYPIVSPGWSLQHEMLFYILFGLVIVDRRLGVLVFGCWGAAIAVAMPFQLDFPASFLLHPVNTEFFFGLALAFAGIRWGWRALVLGVSLFLLGMILQTQVEQPWAEFARDPILRRFLYGGASALAIAGLIGLRIGGGIAKWLGDLSYPLYLIHFPLLYAFFRMGWAPTNASSMIVQVAICIFAASLFNRRLEKPVLVWVHSRSPAATLRVSGHRG